MVTSGQSARWAPRAAWCLGVLAWATSGAAQPEHYDLDRCLQTALQRNLGLAVAHLDVLQAEEGIRAANSQFDTSIGLAGRHEDSELPSETFPTQGASVSTVLAGDVGRQFAYGTRLGLSASSSRLDFEEQMAPFAPFHISQLRIALSQSLWKNARGRADRSRVIASERARDAALLDWVQAREQLALSVHEAYWQAYTATNIFEVNQRALVRAEQLLETNRRYFEDGLIDETEILAAEAQLAEREVDVLDLRNAVASREDQLRDIMNVDQERWDDVHFQFPTEVLAGTDETLPGEEEALHMARRWRADLAALRAERARLDALLDVAGQETRPDLRVSGELGAGDFSGSWGDSVNGDRTVWAVGLQLETTLEQRKERADEAVLQLQRLQVENTMRRLEQSLKREIRAAIRDLSVAGERVRATRHANRLHRSKLQREEEKFEQGRSTTRRIVEYQDDLAFSELAEVRAAARYYLAGVRFDAATGRLLDHSAVLEMVEPVGTFRGDDMEDDP